MKKFTAIILAAGLLVCSCAKASREETYNNQETRIDTFISNLTESDDSVRVVHNSGSHRVVLTEGEGEELEAGGNIAFYYAGYIFSSTSITSSNLFTTNNQDVASAAGWELAEEDALPLTVQLDADDFLEGLYNGLLGVKTGEECYILFSGKYGFGKKQFGIVPANSALCYQIWVDSISNE